jgi:hypothetical protein
MRGNALAAELVVGAKSLNHQNFRYGRYRVWGDLRRSRYVAAEAQPNVTELVGTLSAKGSTGALG